jgi:hypothetical protein
MNCRTGCLTPAERLPVIGHGAAEQQARTLSMLATTFEAMGVA